MLRLLTTNRFTLLGLVLTGLVALTGCEDSEEDEEDNGIVIGDRDEDDEAVARVRAALAAGLVPTCEIDVQVGTWYGECSEDELLAAFE